MWKLSEFSSYLQEWLKYNCIVTAYKLAIYSYCIATVIAITSTSVVQGNVSFQKSGNRNNPLVSIFQYRGNANISHS